MLKVHHLNNSRSQRILWLLEELKVPYEIQHYKRDSKTNLAPPELLEIHPLGKSPVIEDQGTVIAESAAIVEYICAWHGTHMVPEPGTNAHIHHMELMHFAEGSVMTPILLGLYTGRLGEAAAPLQPRIEQELENHFSYMEQVIRPSGHFVLDKLSAADIMLSFPAEIAARQKRHTTCPKVLDFVSNIHARPAFQQALERGGPYHLA